MTESAPFTARTVAWIAAVAVVAFGAFLVLMAYAPDLRSGRDGGAHVLSKSAVGYAGLVQVLRDSGHEVDVARQFTSGRGELVVLTPGNQTTDKEFDEVRKRYAGRPLLIILPKWTTSAHPTRPGWVHKVETQGRAFPLAFQASSNTVVLSKKGEHQLTLRTAAPLRPQPPTNVGEIDRLQSLKGDHLHPLLVSTKGEVLLARAGQSKLYLLSDPDMLNNQGIDSLARARLSELVFRTLSEDRPLSEESDALTTSSTIIFDVTLNGFEKGQSLLKLAFQPPFLAATLCALAAALLAGAQAAVRFGPARRSGRAVALGKGALADNAAGLIRLAKREHRFGGRYAAMVRDQAAHSAGVPRELDAEQRTAMLDRLGRGGRLRDLMAAAEGARDRAGLLAAAQALHRWRSEILRA